MRYGKLAWPSQCDCGHIFLERFVWPAGPNARGEVGFSYCGFCRTRLPKMAKFERTSCSQCGQDFGPGDCGYSHCQDHEKGNDMKAQARTTKVLRLPPELVEAIERKAGPGLFNAYVTKLIQKDIQKGVS
jgi:hypothetical protein